MSKYEIGNKLIPCDHLPDNSLHFLFVILFEYHIRTTPKAVGSMITVTRFSSNLRSVVT